ncbi:hypothetical protein B6D29_02605 [Microgenomates bacterium UTCPR1]|nr:MAG: hypothetical protein B6D29_02605 [Microgenomates bacterium UTCPR1]
MFTEDNQTDFHTNLKKYMDELVNLVYDLSLKFPKEEIYGVTSQIRRASLSIVLNYIEGYARVKKLVLKNFLETSYGSLKETKYLLEFCLKRKYINKDDFLNADKLTNNIGKMIWGILKKL